MGQSKRTLDLVFAMDTTSSMRSCISEAQQCIRSIVDEIVSTADVDVHLALVEYRDHPPQDKTYVTRVHDFTSSVSEMKGWLDNSNAQGGGDIPEAVADALYEVQHLSWCQQATQLCILICDAPPHGLGHKGDKFPNGCPDGHDCMQLTNTLAEMGVSLYVVGCNIKTNDWIEFYRALAHITGGQYIPLADASSLAKVIIGGAREELSLEELKGDIQEEVVKHAKNSDDEESIIDRVYNAISDKGVKVSQLDFELPRMTPGAIQMAFLDGMEAVRGFLANGLDSALDSGTTHALPEQEFKVVEKEVTREQIARMVRKELKQRKPEPSKQVEFYRFLVILFTQMWVLAILIALYILLNMVFKGSFMHVLSGLCAGIITVYIYAKWPKKRQSSA